MVIDSFPDNSKMHFLCMLNVAQQASDPLSPKNVFYCSIFWTVNNDYCVLSGIVPDIISESVPDNDFGLLWR